MSDSSSLTEGGGRAALEDDVHSSPATVSLTEVVVIVLRHRYSLLGVPLVTALLAGTLGVLSPKTYSASAAFTPQGQETRAAGLAGLAAQFGVSIGDIGTAQSPQFYAMLLTSEPILRKVVTHEYYVPGGATGDSARSANLVNILGVGGSSPDSRIETAMESLRSAISTTVSSQTGVVAFTVETRNATLSHDVAQRMITLVHHFNVDTRQTQARARRVFLERRLQSARSTLEATEDSLEAFLEHNRSYENSPKLRFVHQRLQSQVDLRRQVLTSLAQDYEQARIDEVKDTPVITVVTPPTRPSRPDSRHLILRSVLGFVGGGILVLAIVMAREFLVASLMDDHRHYRELKQLWHTFRSELHSAKLWIVRHIRLRTGNQGD